VLDVGRSNHTSTGVPGAEHSLKVHRSRFAPISPPSTTSGRRHWTVTHAHHLAPVAGFQLIDVGDHSRGRVFALQVGRTRAVEPWPVDGT
jgi:hypothetical protein